MQSAREIAGRRAWIASSPAIKTRMDFMIIAPLGKWEELKVELINFIARIGAHGLGKLAPEFSDHFLGKRHLLARHADCERLKFAAIKLDFIERVGRKLHDLAVV